jgi:hypothetical protein
MDDGVMQEPPVELRVIPEEEKVEVSPYLNVPVNQIDPYRESVVHYFDNQLGQDILMLPEADKFRMFQMLKDYADILETIFHAGIPILEYINGHEWGAADGNPHPGINWDYDCEIIRQYKAWNVSPVETPQE